MTGGGGSHSASLTINSWVVENVDGFQSETPFTFVGETFRENISCHVVGSRVLDINLLADICLPSQDLIQHSDRDPVGSVKISHCWVATGLDDADHRLVVFMKDSRVVFR